MISTSGVKSRLTWKRGLALAVVAGAFLFLGPAAGQFLSAQGAADIFASPVQAGCYLARVDRCKIHVDPFTINLATGKKLVRFQLVAIRGGSQTVIYDFRPDQSNPPPVSGSTFTPSLVAKDYAARCTETYSISLQGQDSGDPSLLNLGSTNQFTCPVATYSIDMPVIRK